MEFFDNYEHIYTDAKLIYTPESIPSKATKSHFADIATGCRCLTVCRVETGCSCLQKCINYSFNLFSTEDTVESVQDNFTLVKRDSPLYECNQNCLCSKFCGNRLVQYGPRKNLKIVPSDQQEKRTKNSKGAGLFTSAGIRNGNFICEYAGEIISDREASERFRSQEKKNIMNYIFSVRETFGTNVIKTYIDPSVFGNIGRYINHSCDPNSEIIPVRVNSIIPKLGVFAKKDIKMDEEITFDYGDGQLGFSPSDETVGKKKRCLCDFVNCRKYLPFCKET